jgi:hypothetical protein
MTKKIAPTSGEWKAKGIHIIAGGKVGRLGQAFLIEIPCYENNFSECEESKLNAKLFAGSKIMINELRRLYTKYGDTETLEVIKKVFAD